MKVGGDLRKRWGGSSSFSVRVYVISVRKQGEPWAWVPFHYIPWEMGTWRSFHSARGGAWDRRPRKTPLEFSVRDEAGLVAGTHVWEAMWEARQETERACDQAAEVGLERWRSLVVG